MMWIGSHQPKVHLNSDVSAAIQLPSSVSNGEDRKHSVSKGEGDRR